MPGLPNDLMKKGKHFILIRNPLDILVRVYVRKQSEIYFVVLVILSLAMLHMLTLLFDVCQPSFDKVVPPSLVELSLAEMVAIYSELSQLGRPPPVVDAAELQRDPEVLESFFLYIFTTYHK